MVTSRKNAHDHGFEDAQTAIEEARSASLEDGEDFDAGDLKGFRGDWTESLLNALDERQLSAIGFPGNFEAGALAQAQRAWLEEYQRGAIDAVDAAYAELSGTDAG